MTQDMNVTIAPSSGTRRTAPEEYLWIKCGGCDGEVGVPSDRDDAGVECPSCGLAVQVHGRVLYRPPASPAQGVAPTAEPPICTQLPISLLKSPSLQLGRKSDAAMIWGIMSVVLGWTAIVPIFGLAYYCDASTMAEKEGMPVPRKAV